MTVVVLGMHRSGTSAVVGLLHHAGLNVGAADDLIEANEGNPKGHYELRPMMELNDTILKQWGGTWDNPPAFPDNWQNSELALDQIASIRALIAEYQLHDWVIKDPRITVLLPLWSAALGDDAAYVAMYRHPREVALSLEARDSMPIAVGMSLWWEYNYAMIHHLDGYRTYLLPYHHLVTSPVQSSVFLTKFLNSWRPALDLHSVEQAASFIEPTLWRNQSDEGDIDDVNALYSFLVSRTGAHQSWETPTSIPRLQLPRALLGISDLSRAERKKSSDLTMQLELKINELTDLEQRAGLLRADYETLQNELTDLEQRAGLLRADYETLQSDYKRLGEQNHALFIEHQQLIGYLERIRNRWPIRLGIRIKQTLTRHDMFSKKWQSPSHDQDHGSSRYQLWIDNYEAAIASAVAKEIALQHSGPSFSVVIMPEKGAMDQWISSISSLAHQTYHRWELIIASTPNETLREALATIEAQGHRVSWLTLKTKRHETMRTLYERSIGNWIVQLEAPVQLAPYALASFALAITKNPDAVLVYGDDDSIDDAGRRNKPFFKTDFDRIRLLGHDYLGGAACIAKVQCRRYVEELHDQSGGVTWELTLCATRDFDDAAFIHVPYVLAHHQNVTSQRRKDKRGESRVRSTRQSILEAHLKKLGKSGRVQAIDDSPYYSVSLQPDTWPSVDIIIPTRDGRVLKKCLTSLLEITDYPNFRVCLVDNGSEQEDTLEQLTWAKDNFNALVIRDDGPFNYSRLNNIAVDSTSSELILLLNDDIEITNRDWLTRMVGQFEHDDVGAVGALLWYPNGTVQHGGVITGLWGAAGHAFVGRGTNDEGYWGSLRIAQQLSAVTAACLLFKRQAWSEAGGLDEDLFPVAFNDIDLCLKIRARKWRVVFDPTAQLIHHESLSRGVDETEQELARSAREVANFRKKWRDELLIDPFFNPNLDYASMYFEVDAHAARVLEYPGSALYVGQLLYPTGKLISRNQRYRLEVDEHGSLVLAGPSTRRYLWNAENSHETIKVLKLQHDGNITLIAESDAILWAAGTSSLAPRTMQLTDEGALVAMARDGTEYWRLEIATATEIDTL